jgi:hypothetical protein
MTAKGCLPGIVRVSTKGNVDSKFFFVAPSKRSYIKKVFFFHLHYASFIDIALNEEMWPPWDRGHRLETCYVNNQP